MSKKGLSKDITITKTSSNSFYGIITTNDEKLALRLKKLRSHGVGRDKDLGNNELINLVDDLEIKNYMSDMHSNGEFDNVICFGTELSENQLYKKFHPS